MKKFVFPLDALYKIKKPLKDKLQAEYSAAEATLDKACCKKKQLQNTLIDDTQKYEVKAKEGLTVGDIQDYSRFFEELHKYVQAASKEVDRAQNDVNRKRDQLIEAFKEIKILEKLREKKYGEFMLEEEKTESNVLEDILSFNIAGRKTD